MKNILALAWMIILAQACSNNPVREQTSASLKLDDLKKDFKFANLNAFRVDDYAWGSRSKYYKALDSQTFYLVWQNGKVFNTEGYDKAYLFSWQERDANFQECTILTESEADHGPVIEYCILDKNGRAVDHFTVAAKSDDGGRYYESYGRFIKSDLYEATCIEQEFVTMDSTDNSEVYKGDTTVYNYNIGKDGKVSKKEIYKKTFTSKED